MRSAQHKAVPTLGGHPYVRGVAMQILMKDGFMFLVFARKRGMDGNAESWRGGQAPYDNTEVGLFTLARHQGSFQHVHPHRSLALRAARTVLFGHLALGRATPL